MRRITWCFLVAVSLWLAGCAPAKKMTVLIQMMEGQENYFKNEVIVPFEKQNRVKLDVIHYGSTDSLEQELKKYPGAVGLVKVPFDKSRSLMRKGLFKPLESFLTDQQVGQFENNFLLTSLGMIDGKRCLIPRKFESRIMVYSRNKVADAVVSWRKHKEQIDEQLKAYNGYGLPATYILESDPNQWDYFDLFVAGWIWSHTAYDGKTGARIAHRGRRYSGTSLTMVDRVFQLGGDSSNVLNFTGNAVADAFHWEAAFVAGGIYNSRMWEEAWTGTGIWQGFADGEVFLSFMTQLDCFFLHGTGRDSLNGYFKDPDDMGVATMPKGCSLELGNGGVPAREGSKAITTGGWWWGIPFDTPFPQLSYQLGSYITSTTAQIQECTRFGMVPVRKDILSDMSVMFGGGWITDVYETSFKQLVHNGHTVIPGNAYYDKIGLVYLDAWYDIVVNRNWSADKNIPQLEYIKGVLSSVYIPRAGKILSGQEER